jgi:hypothetical protein
MSYLLLSILVVIFYLLYKKRVRKKQMAFIDNYRFPDKVIEVLQSTYPHLKPTDIKLVMQGLRDYFTISQMAGKKMVAMPSQVVDVAWHEFILFTKNYQKFCHKALGRFLHHTPAEAMKDRTVATTGIKTAWQYACKHEHISAIAPSSLPLLFALDTKLDIKDGFKYTLNCKKSDGSSSTGVGDYCAGDIGCGGDFSIDSSSCSGDSSGCGGGCGGD